MFYCVAFVPREQRVYRLQAMGRPPLFLATVNGHQCLSHWNTRTQRKQRKNQFPFPLWLIDPSGHISSGRIP
jgi:hypothetical protein